MFVRPNVRPDSARGDAVIHKGIPIADFGAVACTMNGVPVAYQEIQSVSVIGTGFSARKLEILFRRGGSLTFEGPRFNTNAIKIFIKQATDLANSLTSHTEDRWSVIVEKRLQEEHAVRIDNLRFLDTGEIYDDEVYLTNVAAPDCFLRAEGGVLTVLHRGPPSSGTRAATEFSLGLAASPVQQIMRNRQRIMRESMRSGSYEGLEDRAAMAMVSLAAVVGAWQPVGFRQRIETFCKLRSINFAKLAINLSDIDYAALALDKRFIRNAFNTISDSCRYGRIVTALRYNQLVDDLVAVAADGIRMSKVSVHLIFEIALFQGRTMSSVPPVIDRVLGLKGQPWIEVNDANWASEPRETPHKVEEPPISEKEARRRTDARSDNNTPPPKPDSKSKTEQRRWVFAASTMENLRFFGFAEAPTERELRTAFASLLKKHHPDRIQMSGTAAEIAAANAMMQEINSRRDWVARDLADFWASL